MIKMDKIYASLLAAVLIVGAALPATAQTPAAAPAGQESAPTDLGSIKIGNLKGAVTLVNPNTGATVEARADAIFTAPTTVITDSDSTILLLFSNGSVVEVQPGSRIEVNQFTQQPYDAALGSYTGLAEDPSPSQAVIRVISGEVVARVCKLNPASTFLILTPTGRYRVNDEVIVVGYDAATGNSSASNISGNGSVVYENNNGEQTPIAPGETLQVPGQIDPNGTVTAGEPTVVPNSPETTAKGDGVNDAAGSGGGGGGSPSPSAPATPPQTTPTTDINDTSLIDPTSTMPGQ